MKEMKRILSLVLCLAMIVGMLPMFALNADAAERKLIDSAIFCSDVHNNPSTVTSVFNGIKSMDSTFNPSTASFVGDTQCTASSVTAAAQEVYSDVQCIYAYGNHDNEGNYGIADFTGLSYGDSTTNYYIYTISESSMGSSNPDTSGFTNTVAGLDKTKPLFIISHLPLHARRGDSNGAPAWYAAISAVAKEMDIFFFWAHNHTGDNSVDQAAYYVANGGSETITIEGGDTVTPNFTYANAGYINPPNKPARNNVATAVYIYSDSVDLVVCNADGLLTGTHAVDVTVDRLYAPTAEPEATTPVVTGIEVVDNNQGIYYVGDELDIIVYEVYSDGSKVAVEGYTTSGFDSNVLGAQTVTVTYGDYTTSVSVNVAEQDAEPVLTGIQVTYSKETLLGETLALKVVATYDNGKTVDLAEGDYTVTGYDPAVPGAQGVIVTYETQSYGFNVISTDEVTVVADGMASLTVTDVSETLTETLAEQLEAGFAAYDIVPNAYNLENNIAVVSMPAPEGANAVYYWNEETQTLEPVSDFTIENGKAVFTTDHFSTYVVGRSTDIDVPEGDTATGEGKVTVTTEKDVYVLVSTPTADNQYIIVNRNTAGSGIVLKENTTTGFSITVMAADDAVPAPYIDTTDKTIMWNATSGLKFKSENGGYYLRYSSGLAFSTSNSTNWTHTSGNKLYYDANTDRYLRYNDGWTTTNYSSYATNVYFYEKQPYEFETTTTGTGIYSIKGNNITQVVNGEVGDVGVLADVIFTPENGGEDTLVDAAVTYEIYSDPAGIIKDGNLDAETGEFTFSGEYGTALVKASATVTVDGEEKTITGYITVVATEPYFTLEIEQGETYIHKGVQNGQTLDLNAQVTGFDGDGDFPVDDATLVWSIESGSNLATINESTGVLTFNGNEGEVEVKVTYEVDENTTLEDYITVHVHKSTAITPEESTTDFPRWPNEGAVRFDKTAQAVGNFSNTGVAMMELSMAGIPQKTGGAVDVVIMLDMTGSMSTTAMTAAEESAIAFAEQIVKNTDGTFNDNRIAVLAFNSGSSSPYTLWSMGTVTEDDWSNFCTNVRTASDKKVSGGTPYDEALEKCQSVLQAAKTDGIGNNHQQFCVFVSDGGPTSFKYITNYDAVKAGTASAYTTSSASASGGSNQPDSNFATIATYTHEYYSTLMKDDGVTMYSVLTGLVSANYPNCTTILRNIATDAGKAYVVEDGSDTTALTGAFKAIAEEIRQAASQIEVADKITDSYEMIFKWPEAVEEGDKVAGQEFYIEVVNYDLNATTHERTGTYDVLTRIYLTEDEDGNLSISRLVKIEDGITTNLSQAPVYTPVGEGEKGYFNLDEEEEEDTYVYVADGTGKYKMTAGATVTGTADTVELHTPYFSYKASDKIITWHVAETTENAEIALRYFLYLTGSLESVAAGLQEGDEGYVAPGTYLTNDYAILEYTNYLDHEVMQYFPEPQLTWNGAQVSYVFYLVNSNGEPVNTAGRVVTFAESVFVTSIHTESVVWNDKEGISELNATRIADELLPDDYELYDENAEYEIHVYQNENGNTIYNYFTITGGDDITKNTTMVYNTKAGTKYSTPGTYTSKDDSMDGFDFANTTVAFAVVWERKLVPDTVVVDYGLPVDINVTTNDFVYNSITSIGTETPSTTINTGLYDDSALSVKVDETSHQSGVLTVNGHEAQVINENVIRFTPGSMEFKEPVWFHYETSTDYYEGGAVKEAYMYSKVTVIPATTIYYEDSFLDLTSFSKNAAGAWEDSSAWTTEGTVIDATQAQDRPGESKISAALDADNNYGYDAAYKTMANHSLGSSAKITVDANTRGEATFTFWGTGFDVISTTSNTSGTLTVQVYAGSSATGTAVKTSIVDTYYGYTMNDAGEWVVSVNEANALYQVPVMKIFGLDYAQYTVKITAGWNDFFDHVDGSTSYDLYLDAIRIYDPTGDQNTTANDAYIADGEAYPEYFEVRDQIISKETFNNLNDEAVSGIVFIDGNGNTSNIAEYTSYGPNNETYLKNGQAIAFDLNGTYTVPANMKLAKIQLAVKTVGNNGAVEVYGVKDGKVTACLNETISTATDMYYDITVLEGMTVVIKSTGDAIISITNVKVTYAPNETAAVATASVEDEIEAPMLFSIRRSTANAALATMNVEEEVPEEVIPETTVPEEVIPETTIPEETEPETEPTKPVKPDNSDLKAAVEAAKQLKEKDYTKESFEAVKAARKAAEKVLKDKKATQAEIDDALENLNQAVEALETKAPAAKPGKNEKPGKDEKPGKADKENQSKPNSNKNNSTIEQQAEQIIVPIANLLFGWLFN